tara:strand:+ start:40 stop:852 length:813 start_codon:yes stop_codon:yes gene_type:complete
MQDHVNYEVKRTGSEFDPAKYFQMFELNDDLEVKILKDIGPQKKSVVVIDNFYKDPDAVRQLCLDSNKRDDPGLLSYLPGKRTYIETTAVKHKIKHIFDDLCFDPEIWGGGYWQNKEWYEREWGRSAFMCNVINDETLKAKPDGIIPHQDKYDLSMPPLFTQFGAVIYLNTPEECAGGTNLWSFDGQMSLPFKGPTGIEAPAYGTDIMSKEEIFEHIHWELNTSDRWKVEHKFEMVYNRLALYESKVLHSQNVELGMFTDYDRINQVLFM